MLLVPTMRKSTIVRYGRRSVAWWLLGGPEVSSL